jgi:hypothetical protein
MNINRKLPTLALALLFPICMSGCGRVVTSIAKASITYVGKGTAKGTAKGAAKGAIAGGKKMMAGSADDVARAAERESLGGAINTAGVFVREAARSAAYVAARGSLKAATSGVIHCEEKLKSIDYNKLLSPVSRVTMRVLIRRCNQNYERLDELAIELNDPSLSDADNERITEEGERVKQEMDRINKKADELYRELG